MGNLGTPEILLILVAILVLFGAKKIPELAQGLGKGIREFRKASRDIQGEIESEVMGNPRTGTFEAATALKCPSCGTSISKDSKFCPSCGKSLEKPRCAKCGAINELGHKFCSECGQTLQV